jgi:hypothetical protein
MNSYEKIYSILTENQNKTDSRLFPGHARRMKSHETRIQRELKKPENQDDQAHSEEDKEKARTRAKAREDAKRKVAEGHLSKEVRQDPGDDMTLARGRIGAGQYAKSWKDKKGAKKQGQKASKLIAKHRLMKKRKADRAEARAQTVSFTASTNLRSRRGK